jgi:hypothetical protein
VWRGLTQRPPGYQAAVSVRVGGESSSVSPGALGLLRRGGGPESCISAFPFQVGFAAGRSIELLLTPVSLRLLWAADLHRTPQPDSFPHPTAPRAARRISRHPCSGGERRRRQWMIHIFRADEAGNPLACEVWPVLGRRIMRGGERGRHEPRMTAVQLICIDKKTPPPPPSPLHIAARRRRRRWRWHWRWCQSLGSTQCLCSLRGSA